MYAWTASPLVLTRPPVNPQFEIAGMEEARTIEPAAAKQPTLDDIYKTTTPSVVSIYKIDSEGRRTDTTTGFVFEPNRILTAFQSIDASTRLELEFSSGRKVAVTDIAAWSRAGDWAVLNADTGAAPVLKRGDPNSVAVGERLIVFNVEGGARVLGGVDIGGRRKVPGFGERIQISPSVAAEAAGGPLLDTSGHVVAILGGSLNPGARFSGRVMSLSPALWNSFSAENAATPISEVTAPVPNQSKTLEALSKEGILSSGITPMPEFMYGGTTTELPKRMNDPMPREISDFSVRDPQISIHSPWVRKAKLSKGELSTSVYDPSNRLRVTAGPKKVTLQQTPTRISFSFSPASLQPGVYRVDLNWDGRTAWRTFIRITE